MLTIQVMNHKGEVLFSRCGQSPLVAFYSDAYQPGDEILIRSDSCKYLCVSLDQALAAADVYAPDQELRWLIPFDEEKLAYPPQSFQGERHVIEAREIQTEELSVRRNIACNPADQRRDVNVFPHATANVETRGEAVFAARNVIDGMRLSDCHGEWPYQSWGIGAREDAWCRLDFGRDVHVDEMVLTLRADFPHDAYWTHGHVVLSDESEISFQLEKTGERQSIPLGKHTVRWMRLERMQKSDDPSAFPSLIEWEVFGWD